MLNRQLFCSQLVDLVEDSFSFVFTLVFFTLFYLLFDTAAGVEK